MELSFRKQQQNMLWIEMELIGLVVKINKLFQLFSFDFDRQKSFYPTKQKTKKLDTFEISSDILGLHFRYRYSWLYQYFKIFTRRLISKKVFPNRCHITIIDISSPDSRLSVLLNTSRFFVIYKSCNQS